MNEVSGQRGTAHIRLAHGWTALPLTLSGQTTHGTTPVTKLDFKPYDLLSLKISR